MYTLFTHQYLGMCVYISLGHSVLLLHPVGRLYYCISDGTVTQTLDSEIYDYL